MHTHPALLVPLFSRLFSSLGKLCLQTFRNEPRSRPRRLWRLCQPRSPSIQSPPRPRLTRCVPRCVPRPAPTPSRRPLAATPRLSAAVCAHHTRPHTHISSPHPSHIARVRVCVLTGRVAISRFERQLFYEWTSMTTGRADRLVVGRHEQEQQQHKDAAAAEARAEASRHALKTATRTGFHRARVDLYEGSNLDTPENEQTRRTAEARSSMGRAATIAVRWVLVVLIVLAAVLVAFGVHECSRWGQHATRLVTELAYNRSGVCRHGHAYPHPLSLFTTSTHAKKKKQHIRKRAGPQSQRSLASAHCLRLPQASSCGVSTPHSRAASTRFSAISTASWSTMFATKYPHTLSSKHPPLLSQPTKTHTHTHRASDQSSF